MERRYGVIFTVLGFIVLFFSMEGWGADWKYFRTDEKNNEWFYDAESILREQDIIIVRTKEILSDKGRAIFIKDYPTITKIKNISYILGRWEINCSKRISRPLSSFWYSSEGCDVFSVYYLHSQFSGVVPDIVMDMLVEIICK